MTSRKSSAQRKLFDSTPTVIHDSSDEGPDANQSDIATPVAKRRKTTNSKNSQQSTPARSRKAAPTAVVTPADAKDKTDIASYVPKYIHKNVKYSRKGAAKLSKTTQRAFAWIQEHVEIPSDMEQNRMYGPLSGSSYEERAVRAYRLGLIQSKDSSVQLCTACANVGHSDEECPTLE